MSRRSRFRWWWPKAPAPAMEPPLPVINLFQVVRDVDLELRPRFTRRGKALLVISASALLAISVAVFWLAGTFEPPTSGWVGLFAILLVASASAVLTLLTSDQTYLRIKRLFPWFAGPALAAMAVIATFLALAGLGFAISAGFNLELNEASLTRALSSMGALIVLSLLFSRMALTVAPPVLGADQWSRVYERVARFGPFTYWLCMNLVAVDLALAGSRRSPWDLGLVQDVAVAGGVLIIVAWAAHRNRVRDSLYRIAEVAIQTATILDEDPDRRTPSQVHLAVSRLITSLHAAGNPKILGATVRPTIASELLACLEYIAEEHLGMQSPAHVSRAARFDHAVANELGQFDVIPTVALLSKNLADGALRTAMLYD